MRPVLACVGATVSACIGGEGAANAWKFGIAAWRLLPGFAHRWMCGSVVWVGSGLEWSAMDDPVG